MEILSSTRTIQRAEVLEFEQCPTLPFLSQTSGEQANGFYPRNLHLTLGKLRLKVPRVRFSHSFRPAILPPRWKRVDKDYEELLIAMLANG